MRDAVKPSIKTFSVALVAAASALFSTGSQAGSFGGPAPFQNGSPLVTGTDGIYQAVATAKNVTGIISFAISNGVQTSTASQNTWNFFVDGQNLTGTTDANISDGEVTGVLGSGYSASLVDGNGTVTLPVVTIIPGNVGSGYFSADINLNSPVAAFKGKGVLTGTPERTDQLLVITESGYVVTPITVPASTLDEVDFKVRGTRLSTSATTTTD